MNDTNKVIIRKIYLLFKVNSLYKSNSTAGSDRCPLTVMQACGAEEAELDALLTSHQIELTG